MEQLKELLKQGDNQIKEIKKQQLILINNFNKDNYDYEIGTIILVNNIKGVISGFVYNLLDKIIYIKYRQLKHNGSLASVLYTTKLRKFKTDGKITGNTK